MQQISGGPQMCFTVLFMFQSPGLRDNKSLAIKSGNSSGDCRDLTATEADTGWSFLKTPV